MRAPRLWVWVGSPDDKLDVMRYVHATDKDIIGQPVVDDLRADLAASRELLAVARARISELESRVAELEGMAEGPKEVPW